MNEINLALAQIDSGNFQIGLDALWAAIDAGSDEARVSLANKFSSVGIHALALDQWLYLLEQGTEFEREAAFGAFGCAVWMRQYALASEILAQYPALSEEYDQYLSDSIRDFSTLNSPAISFADLVQQLLADEEEVARQVSINETFESLQRQIFIREAHFNVSCDLFFNPSTVHSSVSVEVPLGLSVSVSRSAVVAVGSPLDNAQLLLESIARLLVKFADAGSFVGDGLFAETSRKGKSIANKILVILDGDDMPISVVHNLNLVCWALSQIDDEAFAAYILAGTVPDEDDLAEPQGLAASDMANFCPKCGATVAAGASFCTDCGNRLAV